MYRRFLLLLTLLLTVSGAWAAPSNFDDAKREIRKVYAANPTTFYCGCDLTWRGRSGGVPDLKSCGYEIRRNATRANRLEWDHVLTAHALGHQRQCWQEGGRANCVKTDPVFRAMEANMFNLVPSVGEVNADRSNYRFGMLPSTAPKHGQCDFRVDFSQRVVQPRPEVRGEISRIYFYIHDRYNLRMSSQQEQLMMAWDRQYPVTAWERRRNEHIAQTMGHVNPFVTGQRQWVRGYRPVGDGVTQPPSPVQQPVYPSTSSTQAQTASVTPEVGGVIHGNRNSKVYHLPQGCPSYNAMADRNRVIFQSEAEALRSGYRKAGNCR